MFTERFARIPVEIFDHRDVDILGYDKSPSFRGFVMIRLSAIRSYRPCYDDSGKPKSETFIEYNDGSSIVADVSIRAFEEILNEHAT